MLVLTRKEKENLVIEDESGTLRIIISILAVEGEKVKIGINAPRQIGVFREEVWQAIHEQELLAKKLAAEPEPSSFQELRKMLSDEAEETDEDTKKK